MDFNKLLNDDCAAVAQKFAGQTIGPTMLKRKMQFGYNRAARTIEGLIDKGMAVSVDHRICTVNRSAEETEYSDTATPEPTADDYRQLQCKHDELQTMLFNERQKAKELVAQVWRLQGIADAFIENVQEVTELLEASGDAPNIKLLVEALNQIADNVESLPATPAQCLADHAADVAEKYYYMGWEHSLSTKADDGNHYACGKRLAAEFANQLRQPAKAGD